MQLYPKAYNFRKRNNEFNVTYN